MSVDKVRALVAHDMEAVNAFILKQLHSDIILIKQISHYIINSGGKRLRPLIVLLASRTAGYNGSKQVNIAAIIEFIHTATLLHDDVVDNSDQRRHRNTANSIWGNPASVLVGDFLYSRSFEMMVAIKEIKVMDILSHATNQIAEGEVLQLLNCNNADITERQYLDVVIRKTATLFEAATRLAALVARSSKIWEKALANYGLNLGIAFQIIDDVLDYNGKNFGKNIGDDLEEGKPTLPLIRTMQTASKEQSFIIRQAIEEGGRKRIKEVMLAIKSCDAIAYTFNLAYQYVGKAIQALEPLPNSIYREALVKLAKFAVQRIN